MIDDLSEPGAWAWFLANAAHSIRIIPDAGLKLPLDCGEGRDNPDTLPRVAFPFHDTPSSPEDQPDHGA